MERYLYFKSALYKHLWVPTTLYVLQVFRRSNGSPAGTWSCQTSLSPKDSLFKSSSPSCPRSCTARKLSESTFFNQVTKCDPKETTRQNVCPTLQGCTCASCSEKRREELFRNCTWIHGKRQEASGPFPDFSPAWIYTQPLEKLLRWFEFHKEL